MGRVELPVRTQRDTQTPIHDRLEVRIHDVGVMVGPVRGVRLRLVERLDADHAAVARVGGEAMCSPHAAVPTPVAQSPVRVVVGAVIEDASVAHVLDKRV
jgi:hypothetical protein